MRRSLGEAYRVGQRAAPLMPVVWEDHWEQPLASVRARYGVTPLDRRWLD